MMNIDSHNVIWLQHRYKHSYLSMSQSITYCLFDHISRFHSSNKGVYFLFKSEQVQIYFGFRNLSKQLMRGVVSTLFQLIPNQPHHPPPLEAFVNCDPFYDETFAYCVRSNHRIGQRRDVWSLFRFPTSMSNFGFGVVYALQKCVENTFSKKSVLQKSVRTSILKKINKKRMDLTRYESLRPLLSRIGSPELVPPRTIGCSLFEGSLVQLV